MSEESQKTKQVSSERNGSAKKYELLLAGAIATRATSFIFSKMLLQTLSSFNLLGIRFLFAFLLLALLFCKKLRQVTGREILAGIGIGFMFFLTMVCELTALERAESSLVSLLENCSIIFVPVFGFLFLHNRPSRSAVISSLTAMAGVVFLALQKGELTGGFTFALLAAVCYAGAILVTSKLSLLGDSLRIGVFQVGTIGFLALLVTVLTQGTPALPGSLSQWAMLGMQVIVCTGFGFTLQPVAQAHVSAQTAGLFCAISPAIATVLGVTVLHEQFGILSAIGLLLILCAIMLPHLSFGNGKKKPV